MLREGAAFYGTGVGYPMWEGFGYNNVVFSLERRTVGELLSQRDSSGHFECQGSVETAASVHYLGVVVMSRYMRIIVAIGETTKNT